MRILSGKYPEERDWQKWVIIEHGPQLALVMLWRMAAFARDILKRPWIIVSGHRTYDEQVVLYKLWLDGKGNPAAVPGTSGHEFHIAADTHGPGTNWPELMADYKLSPLKQLLAKYGLYISNWLGTSGTTHEWWHVQPIERFGYTGTQAAFLLSDDKINGEDDMLKQGDNNPQVLAWQNGLITVGFPLIGADGKPAEPNSNFGPATLGATNKFLAAVGLPQDGTVDGPAWAAMAKVLRTKSVDALTTAMSLSAAKTKAEADLRTAQAKIAAARNALF